MNKKAFFLASLCAIGLCTWEAQAVSPETTPIIYESNSLPHGYEHIILRGDLLFGIGPNAIEVGASDDEIYIQFNQSFGNVNISIFNAAGNMVYNTVVNTSVQQIVIIPFASVANGTYTVVLDNAIGYVEGDFERN